VAELSAFTRAWIARACADVLRAVGVDGVVPTPLDAVLEHLGVRERLPHADVPPSLRHRLLGAVRFHDRAVFVERRQSPARRRFTEAHEAVHLLCPWHEAALRCDTAVELFGRSSGIEAEANFGAGQLIFQGARFADEGRGLEPSLATAFELAATYGASRHAAAHHYVETHRDALALLVAGRWPESCGGLPVWRSVESNAFVARYGRLGALRTVGGGALAEAVEAARRSTGPVPATIDLPGRGRFHAEVVNNRHCHLLLLHGRATGIPARGRAVAGSIRVSPTPT
jgi:hypothetical protein